LTRAVIKIDQSRSKNRMIDASLHCIPPVKRTSTNRLVAKLHWRSGVKAMHPCNVQHQDSLWNEVSTGLSAHSKTGFGGATDTTVSRQIGSATKCTECHFLREKEELVFMMFGLRRTAEKRLASLTSREYQIMKLVVAGHPSKNIAADLRISQRTVENHRASIMRRTGSKSLPELARLALAADWTTPISSRGKKLHPDR
jgi:DNA-binding CsgD family transcriptional regulator